MSDIALALNLPAHAKLLIIHADDLGMCSSVNAAIFDAFECGAITSASAMVPCAWFPGVAEYARKHPHYDIGIHVTITSEWPHYKWRPVAGRNLPGLVDDAGFFFPTAADLCADAEVLEAEICAQIDAGRDAGLMLSHADAHMYAVFETPAMFHSYVKVAREKEVPILVNPKVAANYLGSMSTAGMMVADVVYEVAHREPPPPAEDWLDFHLNILRSLRPGLSQMTVHPGYDDAELRAVTNGLEGWGAAWRQRDFDVLTSPEFRSALAEQEIYLVNWKQISSAMNAEPSMALRS